MKKYINNKYSVVTFEGLFITLSSKVLVTVDILILTLPGLQNLHLDVKHFQFFIRPTLRGNNGITSFCSCWHT